MKLDINDIENGIKSLLEKDSKLGLIINPVLEKFQLEKKELLEICHIGKFLLTIDPAIKIIDKPKPPNPDFILDLNGRLIGLEHTRIVDSYLAPNYYRIVNLFDNAAVEFQNKYPDKLICATFRLKNDCLDFKQDEKKKYTQLINDFVLEASEGNYTNKPDFITEIRIIPNSIVSYSYIESHFTVKKLSLVELRNSLQGKEIKLQRYYSQNHKLQEFWLVLMIGSLSSISFEMDNTLDYRLDSKFDKVYLMEDFKEKIFIIK